MTEEFKPDELVEDGERYEYQLGVWTNGSGMRCSLAKSQNMTMKFYELHGRSPRVEPKPKPAPRANSKAAKAAKAKAEAVREAIAKAVAAKASDDGE